MKRDSTVYKEIESFTDYELSNCIAYAMAIRNSKALKLSEDIDDHMRALEKIYANIEYDDEFIWFCRQDGYFKDEAHTGKNFSEIDSMVHQVKQVNQFLEEKKETQEIKDKLKTLLDDYWIRYIFENDIVPIVTGSYIERMEVYHRLKEQKLIHEVGMVAKSQDGRVVISREQSFVKFEGTNTQMDLEKTIIGQRFNSLVIPEKYDKRIDVKINLSLPKDELLSFIGKIKDNYDQDRGIVKTPLELLSADLQSADDISRMCTETKNGKEVCFDSRQGLTRSQKLADMFFVYDMVKQGEKSKIIINELSDYYDQTGKNNKMSPNTFKKYRDIAQDFIDNQRYKELLTGVIHP